MSPAFACFFCCLLAFVRERERGGACVFSQHTLTIMASGREGGVRQSGARALRHLATPCRVSGVHVRVQHARSHTPPFQPPTLANLFCLFLARWPFDAPLAHQRPRRAMARAPHSGLGLYQSLHKPHHHLCGTRLSTLVNGSRAAMAPEFVGATGQPPLTTPSPPPLLFLSGESSARTRGTGEGRQIQKERARQTQKKQPQKKRRERERERETHRDTERYRRRVVV